MILRHKRHESPEEWEATLEYVVQKREDTDEYQSSLAPRGKPVVVAFHRNVRIFYYVNRHKGAVPEVTASRPQYKEIAEKCTESDPRCRLVDLIPGDPISLDDRASREVFESWISEFCSPEGRLEEWDPFTGEMKQYKKLEDEVKDADQAEDLQEKPAE
ncbi:hypothetical protein BDW74DRAFT_141551 [Aspergillus multicolor]|uniref:uncharacterized protein n=1 Tax=Aspergillus multicolor TaxID=41759 RepID=UPI003CCD1591